MTVMLTRKSVEFVLNYICLSSAINIGESSISIIYTLNGKIYHEQNTSISSLTNEIMNNAGCEINGEYELVLEEISQAAKSAYKKFLG